MLNFDFELLESNLQNVVHFFSLRWGGKRRLSELWLISFCLLLPRWAVRPAVLEQEPEETSVYAAYSKVGFAGTLGLRMAHCCDFPAKAAEKNMSLCWAHSNFLMKRYDFSSIQGVMQGDLTSTNSLENFLVSGVLQTNSSNSVVADATTGMSYIIPESVHTSQLLGAQRPAQSPIQTDETTRRMVRHLVAVKCHSALLRPKSEINIP